MEDDILCSLEWELCALCIHPKSSIEPVLQFWESVPSLWGTGDKGEGVLLFWSSLCVCLKLFLSPVSVVMPASYFRACWLSSEECYSLLVRLLNLWSWPVGFCRELCFCRTLRGAGCPLCFGWAWLGMAACRCSSLSQSLGEPDCALCCLPPLLTVTCSTPVAWEWCFKSLKAGRGHSEQSQSWNWISHGAEQPSDFSRMLSSFLSPQK